MRRLSKFTGKVLTAKSKTTSSVVASSCTRAAVAATRRAWTHSSHEKARAASRSKDQAERLPRPLEPCKLSPLLSPPVSRALGSPRRLRRVGVGRAAPQRASSHSWRALHLVVCRTIFIICISRRSKPAGPVGSAAIAYKAHASQGAGPDVVAHT